MLSQHASEDQDGAGSHDTPAVNANDCSIPPSDAVTEDGAERNLAEAALGVSELRYRRLFESAQGGIMILDAETGVVFDVNPYLLDLLGFTREEIIGKQLWELGFISDIVASKASFLELQQKDYVRYEDLPLETASGARRDVEFVSNTYMVGDHEVIQCNIRDISDRKHVEEALSAAELGYRRLFESAQGGIMILDAETGVVFDVNPYLLDLLGFTREEIIGKQLWELGFISDIVASKASFLELQQKDYVRYEDLPLETASGARRDVEFVSNTYMVGDHEVIQCNIRDITDRKLVEAELQKLNAELEKRVEKRTAQLAEDIRQRKRAEEELRESNAFLENLLDAANAPIIVWDPQFKIVRFNHAFETLTGLKASVVIGKSLKLLFPPGQADSSMQLILPTQTGQRLETAEIAIQHRDGAVRDVVWNSATLFAADGATPIATIAQGNDITERKAAQLALLEQHEQLERLVVQRTSELAEAKVVAESANRAKSLFLANMSHEIRTPMNAILGFAQLLRRDRDLTDQQEQYASTIMRSGEHLLSLITDILEFSKIEASKISIEESVFDLGEILKDFEVMFRMSAEAKNLRLLVELNNPHPCFIITDETKLRQVLHNLLTNAVKFTQRGGVVLRAVVETYPRETAALRLVIEVEDTGPGIAAEELDRVFQVFEQTESGRQSKAGTGLGLAISRKFAELLGGKLEVTSHVGQGSTFRLEIPVRAGSADAVQSSSLSRTVIALEPGQPPIHVLVADDKEDNRSFLEQLLATVGFQVRVVEDGARAVQEFESWRPQLILMDMRMPVMTGEEAIGHIRKLRGGEEVKIMTVTASVFQEQFQGAISAGADDFLSKPFREEVLFDKIQALLGVQYQYAEESSPAPHVASPLPNATIRMAVATLPGPLVAELRQAALSADLEHILELSEQAGMHNPAIAQEIRRLTAGFEYERLLGLLDNGQEV